MRYISTILLLIATAFVSFSQDSLLVVSDAAIETVDTHELEGIEPFTTNEFVELAEDVKDVAPAITLQNEDSASLNQDLQLFPKHYLPTQRLIWGEKGLMRKFDKFELSLVQREREQNIRHTMITIHQYMGYASLASILASGVLGQQVYSGKENLRAFHNGYSVVTNVLYFSTAAFSLFAPPPMKDREGGFSKLNIHRSLAILHFSSMIATNILGGMIEKNPSLIPYHRAASITAFGSLFVAAVVIKL